MLTIWDAFFVPFSAIECPLSAKDIVLFCFFFILDKRRGIKIW